MLGSPRNAEQCNTKTWAVWHAVRAHHSLMTVFEIMFVSDLTPGRSNTPGGTSPGLDVADDVLFCAAIRHTR